MLTWMKTFVSRPGTALLVLLLVSGLLASCAGSATSSVSGPASSVVQPALSASISDPQTRPNVLLVTFDTLRADALGVYGDPHSLTSTMDSLAQDGTIFSLAMTPVPQTNPTHASIFTGMFPSRHGISHHMASFLSIDARPIAEILADAGYTTAGHYSWISFDPEYSGLERGFATYERHTVDRPWPADQKPDWYEQYLDSKSDVTSDGVISWAESGIQEPFFLWIHYNDAHWPYEPPAPFDTMFATCGTCPDGSMDTIIRIAEGYSPTPEEAANLRALYDGEVAFEDQQFGRVISWLQDRGMLDNTLVIVTSDHGEGFGEKGLWSHQSVLYNTAARVPLIIRYPDVVPAGVVKAPVSTVDILPTVLDILGIDHPSGIEGRSLLPLMLGQETGEDRVAISQLWDARQVALTYQGMKLVKDRETGELSLYDMVQDVSESVNLVDSLPDIAAAMEAMLDEWVRDQGF